MTTAQPRKKMGRPFPQPSLIIRVHPQQRPIPLRGRTAQVAYMLLQQRDKPHSADQMGMRLSPAPSTRTAAQTAVYEAISELRKLAPNLIYKARYAKGWRIASDVHVEIVWKDPTMYLPVPTARIDPNQFKRA